MRQLQQEQSGQVTSPGVDELNSSLTSNLHHCFTCPEGSPELTMCLLSGYARTYWEVLRAP